MEIMFSEPIDHKTFSGFLRMFMMRAGCPRAEYTPLC